MSEQIKTLCLKVREDLVDYYHGKPYAKANQCHMLYLLPTGRWRFFDEDFSGACGVAAYMLQQLAKKHNLDLTLAGHEYHFFCQNSQGLIVDPTFSQFNPGYPVYIGPGTKYHEPMKVSRHSPRRTFKQGIEARELLKEYPDCQNPFSSYHKKTIQAWLNSL